MCSILHWAGCFWPGYAGSGVAGTAYYTLSVAGALGLLQKFSPTTPLAISPQDFWSCAAALASASDHPLHAKLFIVLAMGTSFVYVIGFSRLPAGINFVVAMIMMAVATYLLSRPSSLKPEEDRTE